MERNIILVVCFTLWMNRCFGMPMSRQDFTDFMQYIQRTSRPDRQTIHRGKYKDGVSISEFEEGDAWENGDKFEGDMILNRRQRLLIVRDVIGYPTRNGYRSLSKRWPDKALIYTIKKQHFSTAQIEAIETALEIMSNVSCIKFRKATKRDKHKIVVKGTGSRCFSVVGFQKGEHVLNLNANYKVGEGCFRTGSIQHEFLHALGFFHMHSNPNRNEYVRIHWDNIKPASRAMFAMYGTHEITDFGIEYEYNSVMHYSRKARSKNGKDTIEPLRDPTFDKGQRAAMTYKDIRKLNLMYCGRK